MNEQLWAMARRASTFGKGRVLSQRESGELRQYFKDRLPEWYIELLREVPLMECELEVLTADDDYLSVQWMSSQHMIQEDGEAYPGLVARTASFVPVANCSLGTGDPYFVRFDGDDPALWQVSHDSQGIIEGRFDLNEHVQIAPSLSDAFARCVEPDNS